MKFLRLSYLSILLLALAVMACNRELDPTPEYLEKLYPIEEGKQRIYHVIDTSYASATSLDVRTYYKREYTSGTEIDLLGREISKLWLYTSPDTLASYDWEFDELWTQYSDGREAERTEGNTRYIVMKMPSYEGMQWNGNLYNNLGAQPYTIRTIDTTVTIRGTTFENCVYVEQIPFRRPVSTPCGAFFLIEHAYEIYAPGIGKIVRYFKYYEEQNCVPNQESRVYYEELVEHDY